MSNQQHPNLDDLLERSLSAMRNETIPAGPSERTIADALSALRGAKAPKYFSRRVMDMIKAHKMAASLALMLSGFAVYFAIFLFGSFASVSFAQVAEKVQAIKSMTCTVTVERAGNEAPVTFQEMFMSPGLSRIDMGTGTSIITDSTKSLSLILNASDKSATLIDVQMKSIKVGQPMGSPTDMIAFFKGLAANKPDAIEDKQIGDIKAKGFRVKTHGVNQLVYVDPKTGLPIEIQTELDQVLGVKRVTANHFNFEANLDPALFSLETPVGYTKKASPKMEMSGDLADNLVPLLKAYAAHKAGQFPPKVDDMTEIAGAIFSKTNTRPTPADAKLFLNMSAARSIFATVHQGEDWDYLPAEAKLGDKEKIIFWYQPAGTNTYKAVYGDLRVSEITAAQVPGGKGKAGL